MLLPSGLNTCRSSTARPRRHSKTSYSTCPVASGLLQRRADRSSSFHTGTIPARVLHAAACTVLDLKPRNRVTPALRELHWLPVSERIQYKLCLLAHKSLLGHTPEYISDLTPVAEFLGRSTVRASSRGNLVVPRTCRRIGDRAVSVAAPRAWNKLPTELKRLRSTGLFRHGLKTFLFDSVYGHQDTD